MVIHGTPLYALILGQGITANALDGREHSAATVANCMLQFGTLPTLAVFPLPLPPSCYYFPCLATCTHLPNRTIIDAHKKNARRRRGTNIVVAHKANNNAVNDDVNADDDEDDDVANNDADDDHDNDADG